MKLSRNFRTDSFSKKSKSLMGFSKLDMLAAIAVATLLMMVLGVFSLATPTVRPFQAKIPYSQSGAFSYSAPVSASSIYGTAGLTTGDPVLLNQVPLLNFSFKYQFSGSGTSVIAGTEQLVAVANAGGITRSIPLQASPLPVSGSTFSATGTLDSATLTSIFNTFSAAFAGAAGTQMTLQIFPNIKMKGSLSGHSLNASYNPSVLFSFSSSVLELANPAASQSSGLLGLDRTKAQLTPSSSGSVTYQSTTAARLPFGIVHPSVLSARLFALFGFLACLLAAGLILWPLQKADDDRSVAIDARYGPRLLTVDKISFQGSAVVTTQSIAVLISLANKYHTKVLHSNEHGHDRYAVFDNGIMYLYELPLQSLLETGTELDADRIAAREVILDGLATE